MVTIEPRMVVYKFEHIIESCSSTCLFKYPFLATNFVIYHSNKVEASMVDKVHSTAPYVLLTWMRSIFFKQTKVRFM